MHFTAEGLAPLLPLLGGRPVYSLNFSLDGRGRPAKGVCAVTGEALILFTNGKETFRCSLAEVEEYTTVQLVGSGAFGIVRGGKAEQLCICTQSELSAFAELGRMLDYHRETGLFPEPDEESGPRTCPKCGGILPEGSGVCFHCEKKGKYLWRVVALSLRYKGALIASIAATVLIQLLWIVYPYLQRIVIDG